MQLIVEDLCIERGGRRIAGPLSFRLGAGEALLVTGPNGAGKTSLLKVIAGFLAPSRGSVVLKNDRAGAERPVAEYCHHVGHENAVKGRLTVHENVAFWAAYLGGSALRVSTALEQLGLAALPHVPAAYLSAGQRRRLALARLLAAERPVWLLDEPTAALDERATATLSAIVEGHLQSGGLAVIATHLPLALANARELHLALAQPSV